MSDSKITALTAITTVNPATFPLVIVDTSDTSMAITGTTKKVTTNQLLGSGGTATLASATITGDLTVRTNKLAVTSTGVGIGTASPVAALQSAGTFTISGGSAASSANGLHQWFDTGTNTAYISAFHSGVDNRDLRYDAKSHVWTLASGTAMTLNSTGLGVGGSPSGNAPMVLVEGAAGTYAKFNSKVGAKTWSAGYRSGTLQYEIQEDGTERFVIANGGNVGIGVTPSAWSAGKALEISSAGNALWSGTGYTTLMQNAVQNSGYKYGTTNPAARYDVAAGTHAWFVAPSGTAGTAITFAQAMTLDASGRLLVGKSASGFTTVGAEIRENGEVIQTIAASTDATYVSKVYSSTAAAYRFYVGLGGTVFATNTTISAISDARLKENVQDIDVGLGAILALKPRKFDWKAGKGKDIKGDRGFIAQEFEQVFPQLVDQWADESPEGEAPYKSVRQDLIPVLVKAIQELAARVQTLETR